MNKRLKRTMSALLVLVMLICSAPSFEFSDFEIADLFNITASAYSPRTTAPDSSNAYYYSSNIFYQSGYGMPNCTCYAYGRAYELLGKKPKLSTGNAGAWWNYNINGGYYSYGSTPKLGAIAVWDKYDNNQGHVAVVEKISGSTVTISESHWNGTYFNTRTMNSDSSNYLTSYRFRGYIYVYTETTHTHNYTQRLYESDHPHRISERCSDYDNCGGWRWTNDYKQVKTCKDCWHYTITAEKSSISVGVGKSVSIGFSGSGFYPDTAKVFFDYDDSIADCNVKSGVLTVTGKKAGTCNFTADVYSDINKTYKLTSKTVKITVENQILTVNYHANGGSISSDKSGTYKLSSNFVYNVSDGSKYAQKWTYNNTKEKGLTNGVSTFGL